MTELDDLQAEVEMEPETEGWGMIDRSIYRRNMLDLIEVIRELKAANRAWQMYEDERRKEASD